MVFWVFRVFRVFRVFWVFRAFRAFRAFRVVRVWGLGILLSISVFHFKVTMCPWDFPDDCGYKEATSHPRTPLSTEQ